MYLEFATKQLNEYNKLIKIIESCETVEHHSNAIVILRSFGKMCDSRKRKLRNLAIKNALKLQFETINEYYKYKEATMEQVKTLIDYSNSWIDQYEAWEKSQEIQAQSQSDRGEKIDVVGFAKLLKKKRKK